MIFEGLISLDQCIFQLRIIKTILIDSLREQINMGVGMVVVVAPNDAEKLIQTLKCHNKQSWIVGRLIDGSGEVVINQ